MPAGQGVEHSRAADMQIAFQRGDRRNTTPLQLGEESQ